jgi:hypothetical protein
MPSKKKQIKVYVTMSQKEAIREATEQSGLSPSDARRAALRLFCEKYNVDFPDNMPQHGGDRKTK